MKIFLFVLCCIFLCGCGNSIDYLTIRISDFDLNDYTQEIAFLESLFETEEFKNIGLHHLPNNTDTNTKNQQPAFFIEFFTSWEYEISNKDLIEIIISKKYFIPSDDALAQRTNTTLDACLNGTEKIIQIDELQPPFVALRVDGKTIGDEDYPLIETTGIKIKIDENIKVNKTIEAKLNLLQEFLKQIPKPLIQPMPQPIWIASGGDMMLERGATELLLQEGPESIFGATAQLLKSSDVSIVNLEGPISLLGERARKTYTFRFIPEVAPALRDTGINVVLHANNHTFDYGEEAFLDSLINLSRAGIGFVGAGVDIEAASDPFIFSKGNQTVQVFGLASFPREMNGWDGVSAAAGIDRAGMLHVGRGGREMLKQKFSPDSINVVVFHGGTEWSLKPDDATRELYTDLIASGADLIIGTHPHIVQGFEWVNGKPVFWSLGNYVFGGMGHIEGGAYGLFIHLAFYQGKLLYMEPYPLFLNNIRTEVTPAENLNLFYARSRELRR
ncbi:MAG: CapA family protein [Treponema sp.]|nr:CapA family protein [Treponema sp.]